jgi:hypothetical protein
MNPHVVVEIREIWTLLSKKSIEPSEECQASVFGVRRPAVALLLGHFKKSYFRRATVTKRWQATALQSYIVNPSKLLETYGNSNYFCPGKT